LPVTASSPRNRKKNIIAKFKLLHLLSNYTEDAGNDVYFWIAECDLVLNESLSNNYFALKGYMAHDIHNSSSLKSILYEPFTHKAPLTPIKGNWCRSRATYHHPVIRPYSPPLGM
jgi:hypothetical protein